MNDVTDETAEQRTGAEGDEVLLSIAVGRPVQTPFTYRLPRELGTHLEPGTRVAVPFGRSQAVGFVLPQAPKLPEAKEGVKIRDIARVLDDGPLFDAELLSFLLWAARYYRHPTGEVLRAALPPRLSGMLSLPPERVATKARQKWAALTEAGKTACLRGSREKAIQSYLASSAKSCVPLEELNAALPGSGAALKRLEEKGLCRTWFADRESAPADEMLTGKSPLAPTDEQQAAIGELTHALRQGKFAPFLLHGVTGSGKTEVYLRAIEEALREDKGALVLVPEISLTPQLVGRFRARFGGRVALLHSALRESERQAEWMRLKEGRAQVAVGVRSAIFAPVRRLGFIVVDEEHDGSFKQEEGFHYSARDLAVVRAQKLGCPVVLGSATPSLETLFNAESRRYGLLRLTRRVDDRPMPEVRLIDLRESRGHLSAAFPQIAGRMRLMASENERRNAEGLANADESALSLIGGGRAPSPSPQKNRNTDDRPLAAAPLISPELAAAIGETLAAGRQTILFLNRRGATTFHLCLSCGQPLTCPNCAVSLTLHQRRRELMCHYCGERFQMPDTCPHCRGRIDRLGMGTEQAEAELQSLFPAARIERLDRDSADTPEALTSRLSAFARGEKDILIGTQMVAKGHDFPGVLLVGVLLADVALNLPDFRAAERTFQLITQVAGRAGRGKEPGRVIVQTFNPEAPAIAKVIGHDFDSFAKGELELRRRGFFPPFSRLACCRISGLDPEAVESLARETTQAAAQFIRASCLPVRIQGPSPAPISLIKGRTRWQLLIKAKDAKSIAAVCEAIENAASPLLKRSKGSLRAAIDIDPVTLL